MRTKRCGKKNRTRKRQRRSYRKLTQRGGAAVCATGMCGAGLAKVGTVIMSSIGSYKVLSNMKGKSKKKRNVYRTQKLFYKDTEGRKKYFTIKQTNNKLHIKNGKKITDKKYSSIKKATQAYDKKLKTCIQRKFKKC